MNLRSLGERAIIDRIWAVLGEKQDYDDCSVIEKNEEEYLLLTTDYIGESTHFKFDWDAYLIGKFFASINLSDIAAMGGVPKAFMAAMFFSRDTEMDFVEQLVKGMHETISKYEVSYLGGDFKESRAAGLCGFAVGEVEKGRIIRRKGAAKGNAIFITGPVGKQAAGYILWKNGHPEGVEYLLDVTPRIYEGRKIGGIATAGMDLSDGLSASLKQMEKINGVPFHIDFEEIPVSPLAYEVHEDYNIPLEYLILEFGGEYELLYTSNIGIVGKEIGMVGEKSGVWLGDKRIETGEGYEHFGEILGKIR